jgi:hypothetical protein
MAFDVIINAGAAITVSLVAALFAQLTSRYQRDARRKMVEEAETIAGLVRAREAERKAVSVDMLLDKLPHGLSPDQFLSKLDEISAKAIAPPTQREEANAVEALINGYHEQALDQARAQLWFSIAAATVGFVWILYAGMDIRADSLMSATKTLPGIVMDAVAFLFFRQASETRQRATELYDRLRRDKQIDKSLTLVTSIEDTKVRSAVKAQMSLHMAGLAPAPIDLSHFLSPEGAVVVKADTQ